MPPGREINRWVWDYRPDDILIPTIWRDWTHIGLWNAPAGGTFYGYVSAIVRKASPGRLTEDVARVGRGGLIQAIFPGAPTPPEVPVFIPASGIATKLFDIHILDVFLRDSVRMYMSLHRCPPGENPGLTGEYELNSDSTLLDNVYHRINLNLGFWN